MTLVSETQWVHLRITSIATTTNMTSINQKHEIMQSLETLDQSQTSMVLQYVKSLVHPAADDQRIKQEALRQIRQALGGARTASATF
jgi:hypothetical protein